MDYLVSVIIPVYNVEQYLDRCILSVVNQSYKNLEILLIDDGSKDSCPQMCDKWAQKDERIKVIHKENGGLSDARNVGVDVAQGEYIAFVDSDDMVALRFVELLLETAYQQNADIVECSVRKFCENDCFTEVEKTERLMKIFTPEKAMEELINDGQIRQHVWNKLYRKETIGDIRFPNGKLNEDEFWTYKIIGASKRICRIGEVLYGYYQRSGSIMGTKYGIRRLDALEAKAERIDYIEQYYPQLVKIARYNFYISCRYAGQMCLKYITDREEKKKALERVESFYWGVPLTKAEITGNSFEKIWFFIFRCSPVICCRIRNWLGIGL